MLKFMTRLFERKEPLPLVTLPGHALYEFTSCPFCFKVRHAAASMGIELELRNIHQSREYAQELRGEGGRSMVPCLRIENEQGVQWMYESDDIVRYLKRCVEARNTQTS